MCCPGQPNEGHDPMDARGRSPGSATLQAPLVVCISADPAVRQRVVRQLDGGGVVLMCPDLDSLRTVLGAGIATRDSGLDGADAAGSLAGVVTMGELVVDPRSMQVSWRGRALPLTRLECEFVSRLAPPPARGWPSARRFSAAWAAPNPGANRTR